MQTEQGRQVRMVQVRQDTIRKPPALNRENRLLNDQVRKEMQMQNNSKGNGEWDRSFFARRDIEISQRSIQPVQNVQKNTEKIEESDEAP